MAVIQQNFMHIDAQFSGYHPVRILEIELENPLPTISALDEKKGSYYQRARCLVRLHTQPLGLVELKFSKDELSPDEYAMEVWQALNVQINEHLLQDGLPSVTALTSNGLPSPNIPLCIQEREQFLTNAPFVSVIVSTHDRPERLATCLSSLMSLCYSLYEVIVVDNAPSTNATADLVQKLSQSAPFIRYVREDRPGLSLARNCGIRVARGKILAFTDDDVVVDSCWLVELAKAFSYEDNVVCVTSLILPLELETVAQAWFEEFGGFNKGFTRRIFDRTDSHMEIPLYPFAAGHFGAGAGMAFTSAFLRSIGGFDPSLGAGSRAGGEDLAAFLQVIILGNKLVYEPASILYHLHRRDYAGLCKQIYHYGTGPIAVLTKAVLENPLLLFDLIAKVPYGLYFILSSRSPKNRKRSKNYPKDLIILERKGMLYGPFAYLRSRWETRKLSKKTLALDEICAITLVEG